ncbi:MAG: calcium-binding protein [Nanoarchaeota archaeon]|nr:calcium-binding protein [Nanoarchaeota archaeon]
MKQAKEISKMKQEYDKIIEEATVDCYDENEAFQGVVCTLSDELEFPFDAKLLGQEVEVTGVDENSSGLKAGIIMKVSFNGKKYKASLLTLDITDKSNKNNKLIEAYRYWAKKY